MQVLNRHHSLPQSVNPGIGNDQEISSNNAGNLSVNGSNCLPENSVFHIDVPEGTELQSLDISAPEQFPNMHNFNRQDRSKRVSAPPDLNLPLDFHDYSNPLRHPVFNQQPPNVEGRWNGHEDMVIMIPDDASGEASIQLLLNPAAALNPEHLSAELGLQPDLGRLNPGQANPGVPNQQRQNRNCKAAICLAFGLASFGTGIILASNANNPIARAVAPGVGTGIYLICGVYIISLFHRYQAQARE